MKTGVIKINREKTTDYFVLCFVESFPIFLILDFGIFLLLFKCLKFLNIVYNIDFFILLKKIT